MSSQSLGPFKGGATLQTGERPESQMCSTMLCQMTGRSKGRSAFIAEVQLDALVATHVVLQRTGACEFGPTDLAAVGFDAAVLASMSS